MKDHSRFPWKVGALLKGYDLNPVERTSFQGLISGRIRFIVMEIVNRGEPARCRLLQVRTQKETNEAYSPPYEGWIEDSIARDWELVRIA